MGTAVATLMLGGRIATTTLMTAVRATKVRDASEQRSKQSF